MYSFKFTSLTKDKLNRLNAAIIHVYTTIQRQQGKQKKIVQKET